MTIEFPDKDRKELQFAKNLLENPGIAAKVLYKKSIKSCPRSANIVLLRVRVKKAPHR